VCYYSTAYDQARKLWKVFEDSIKRFNTPDGTTQGLEVGSLPIDLQFGMASGYNTTVDKLYGHIVQYPDLMASALLRRASR
jgi:hypothetical protein